MSIWSFIPPIVENLMNPFSSMNLTINPISSMWDASITVGPFLEEPFLVANTFPMWSTSISSATSFNSLLMISAIFSSWLDMPGVIQSSSINLILSSAIFSPMI